MKIMKNKLIRISAYFLLILIVSITIYAVSTHHIEIPGTVTKPKTNVVQNITISISSDAWSLSHTYEFSQNLSVYEILNQTAHLYNFTITKTYFTGYDSFFIESINNVKNGQNNKYWQFYVNGVYANKGCSQYFVSNNDVIEWEFEKSSFNF
jgi:hypothetical protein